MNLGDLIAGIEINPAPGADLGARICDITEDSRTAMPGSLFIARRGVKTDGKGFVAAAVKAGAVAVLSDDPEFELPAGTPAGIGVLRAADVQLASALLAERFYREPTSRLALVGVTGTKGKTTTTWLIHQLLNRVGLRCGLIGTVCIDDGSEMTPATLTTPPAIELSRTMARMLDCGCKAAAMEVSSHALHQRRVGGLRFKLGLFTNLTHDHLDYHHTMEAYAAAKAMLFEALPEESHGGVAIVNAQDPWAGRMVRDTRARVIGCVVESLAGGGGAERSVLANPECRAVVRGQDAGGSDVEMTGPWGRWDLRLPLVGAHNVMNALQAACTALQLGLAPSEIEEGLVQAKSPPGRLEPVTAADDPFAVYVDYAHTEDSLRKVLAVARGLTTGRLIVVFGCGGDRDRTKRPRMGSAAAELSDIAFLTSDNPRTEDPGAIIEEVLTGVDPSQRARMSVEPDREAAIRAAIKGARAGDIVLIAGKGHEDYQILSDGRGGTVKRHFDDREVARAALAARGLGGVVVGRARAQRVPGRQEDR